MKETFFAPYISVLQTAFLSKKPIPAFSASGNAPTMEDAYRIQDALNDLRYAGKGEAVGYKIGLSADAIQKKIGCTEPDYGVLFADKEVRDGIVSSDDLIQPKVKGEIGIVLGEDLFGTDYTPKDIQDRTAFICPAIEIVDCRILDWTFKIEDTICDNSASGKFIRTNYIPYDGRTLNDIGLAVYKNGALVGEGNSNVVLGNPFASVAWLANKLGSQGKTLKKGMFILSGSLAGMEPAKAGDTFRMEFDGFEPVTFAFCQGENE